MTDLYRGLLLVLTDKFNELVLAFRSHIQSFKHVTDDPTSYFDVGVLGFWNLMLEIVLTIFALSCLVIGVGLIAFLAIIFYPCHGFIRYSSLVLKNIKGPDTPLKEQVPNETPTIIRKDVKEKE